MSNINFKKGSLSKLNSLTKSEGTIYFAREDGTAYGQLFYDVDGTARIKIAPSINNFTGYYNADKLILKITLENNKNFEYEIPIATDSSLGLVKSGGDITINENGIMSVVNSSHTHSASNISSGTLSSNRLPTVPITKGGTGSTTAEGALTNLGLTATASELNYCDGVTSNIQTQLNGKANSDHPHNYAGSSSAGGAANSAIKVSNKFDRDTSNSKTAVEFYKADGTTLNQYIEMHNIGGIIINPAYNGTADRWSSSYGLHIGPSALQFNGKAVAFQADVNTALNGKSSSTHTHSSSYTPAGDVSQPTFTGTAATSGGPSGTSTVASSSHTHKYTAAGSVSQPTFTGTAATSGGPSGTTSVYSITGVGSVPSLSASVTNKCLTLTFGAGSVPTRSSVTLASSNHTHSVTATGTVSKPTFTGSEATTTSISGTTSVAKSDHTHSVTATGSVSKPSFTGTAATITTGQPK